MARQREAIEDPEDWRRLGEFIASRRQRRGLTQKELADAAGVTVRSVVSLEAGTPRTRIPPTLARIEEALDLAPDTCRSVLAGRFEGLARPKVEKLLERSLAQFLQGIPFDEEIAEQYTADELERAARVDPAQVLMGDRDERAVVDHLEKAAKHLRAMGCGDAEVESFVSHGQYLVALGLKAQNARLRQLVNTFEKALQDRVGIDAMVLLRHRFEKENRPPESEE